MGQRAIVDDTYAEAFRSIYARVLVTARDRYWLDRAAEAACGHASSTIMCDCEAGVEQFIDSETPDGRPGVVVQFHVPRFRKDRKQQLERALLARISQNVLTCPTARCFNLISCDGGESENYFRIGRKLAFFGDSHEFRETRFGRNVWVVPIMAGEFILDRRFGFADGVMGGNLWFMGDSEDTALDATQRAVDAIADCSGVIMPFPGGIASSGSKAGSRYKFLFASTNHPFCPTLADTPGVESVVPEGVTSIMEIIINGRSLDEIHAATMTAIEAAVETPGLHRISAGNYGGRLGKSFIHLTEKSRLSMADKG